MAKATETMVRAIATTPMIFDFLSSCLRYFQANHSPNGARKKLTRQMIICLETVVEGGIVLSPLPQLGQKVADEGNDALQAEQTVPASASMLAFPILIKQLLEQLH